VPRSGLLDRERIVARPGFNRWLVPPAALAIHLCIGMAYGFSVFWLPLSRALGVTTPITCPNLTLAAALFTAGCDWRVSDLGWIYTLFFVFLGSSAALWGGWLERAGPRKAGVVSAVCWCGGIVIAALGVIVHQLWIMWIGAGVVGGIGLGLGYISPVSTLVKWFPDRRGMATGMAIMGFGGGAMIGAPLADRLMTHFRSPASVGVWQTFLVLAAIYFVAMMAGAFGYRIPPPGWRPDDMPIPDGRANKGRANGGQTNSVSRSVDLRDAHKTKQFWLIWAVLCLNVSAGIGVIGMASPMLQEIFGASAAVAAGFTGLISLFNIGGRFFWASLSDRIGRKVTYYTFFILGIALYTLTPTAARSGNQAAFVLAICVIVSMYGGGFATIPAYLADIFGTQYVGAIHGRLLTAWSTAGIVGPVVVNYLREAERGMGVPSARAYDVTMYILAGMLVFGLIANALVTPLADRWFMKVEKVPRIPSPESRIPSAVPFRIGRGGFDSRTALAWTVVGVPIAWGVWVTLSQALVLFSNRV
jgi:MFS family permease